MKCKRLTSPRRILTHEEIERILSEHQKTLDKNSRKLEDMARRVRTLEIEAGLYRVDENDIEKGKKN